MADQGGGPAGLVQSKSASYKGYQNQPRHNHTNAAGNAVADPGGILCDVADQGGGPAGLVHGHGKVQKMIPQGFSENLIGVKADP